MNDMHRGNSQRVQPMVERRRDQRENVVYVCNLGMETLNQIGDIAGSALGINRAQPEINFLPDLRLQSRYCSGGRWLPHGAPTILCSSLTATISAPAYSRN